MLNGKAISRELWGHYVVDSAMHIILFDLLMLQNQIRENFDDKKERVKYQLKFCQKT